MQVLSSVHRWDWDGDGTWDTGYSKINTMTHQYSLSGSWLVTLEVKDAYGSVFTEAKSAIVVDGSFTDSRDGHSYIYKTIGSQTWMAENLAYLPATYPSSAGSDSSAFFYVSGYEGNSIGEAKATNNYACYGVLYNWEAAKRACPAGWHLPNDEEWKVLENYAGMSQSGMRLLGPLSQKLITIFFSQPPTPVKTQCPD